MCGASPDARRTFPPERLRRLDDRIRGYERDGEYEIVAILVATFLETLLEDILDRIMETRGADVAIRAAVLDGQRAVGQRISRLFPTLTGEQFEDAAEELGFRDFPHRWRELRAARNAFIHDAPLRGRAGDARREGGTRGDASCSTRRTSCSCSSTTASSRTPAARERTSQQ